MRYQIIMASGNWIDGSVKTNDQRLATRLARFMRFESITAYVVDSETNRHYFPSTKQWVDEANAKLILAHLKPRSERAAQDAILEDLKS